MPENSCPESDQNRWLRIPIADIGTGGNPRNVRKNYQIQDIPIGLGMWFFGKKRKTLKNAINQRVFGGEIERNYCEWVSLSNCERGCVVLGGIFIPQFFFVFIHCLFLLLVYLVGGFPLSFTFLSLICDLLFVSLSSILSGTYRA